MTTHCSSPNTENNPSVARTPMLQGGRQDHGDTKEQQRSSDSHPARSRDPADGETPAAEEQTVLVALQSKRPLPFYSSLPRDALAPAISESVQLQPDIAASISVLSLLSAPCPVLTLQNAW